MSMLDTSIIIPTHNEFRNRQKAKELIECEEYCTYILNNQRGPIVLIQTEDNQLWCHDGHHRLAAIDWHDGKINEQYVEIRKYTYAQMNEINLDCGYVTPYDPRLECRCCNFWEYKNDLLDELEEWYVCGSFSIKEKVAKDWAESYWDRYKEKRRIHTLRELCHTL